MRAQALGSKWGNNAQQIRRLGCTNVLSSVYHLGADGGIYRVTREPKYIWTPGYLLHSQSLYSAWNDWCYYHCLYFTMIIKGEWSLLGFLRFLSLFSQSTLSLSSTRATCYHRQQFKNNTRHHPRYATDMSSSPTNSSNSMPPPSMDKITLTVGSPSTGSSATATSSWDNATESRVVMGGKNFQDRAIEDLETLGPRDGSVEVPPNGV